MDSHIHVADLVLSYRWKGFERVIFDKLSFQVPKHAFVSVIGGNGSGKSSLFKLMLGLEQADSGQIRIEGNPVEYGNIRAVRDGSLAYFPQHIQDMLLSETVADELSLAGISLEEARSTWDFRAASEQPLHALSGGELQTLGLLSFIHSKAHTLLLDEPTSFLDHRNARRLHDHLKHMHANGATILHATQYPSELEWGDHVLDLDRPAQGLIRQ